MWDLSVLCLLLSCESELISKFKVVFKVWRENRQGEEWSLSQTTSYLPGRILKEGEKPGC